MPDRKDIIEALLKELAGYQERGDDESAKAVLASLRHEGWKPPAKRAAKRPKG
jgi:hypothetical protein